MKYVALMYADSGRTKAITAEERAEIAGKHDALGAELIASGELQNGAGLVYPEETTTLRWGRPAVAGPLAMGAEQFTAYYVLECDTADRANEIAARLLDFHVTAVEVRAVHDWFDISTPD
jgi:hypothetical protein